MTHHGLFGPPPRNPSRKMLAVFAAAAMVAVIWVAIYFRLPSGVVITMIGGTALFIGLCTAIDFMERAERAEREGHGQ